jgi:hypothetical protein
MLADNRARPTPSREIDASIAAKAEYEYVYDKPYEDKKRVCVAGPFTVESLSPHRVLGVDEDDELIDGVRDPKAGYGEAPSFAHMVLENLKTAGVQQAHKADKVSFTALSPWPGKYVCAEGRYLEGTAEKRAAILIGPEFGTVTRPDLVEAAREAADAAFDVLVACAFNFEAHTTEFNKLGRVPVLKARMNADLHMADDLTCAGRADRGALRRRATLTARPLAGERRAGVDHAGPAACPRRRKGAVVRAPGARDVNHGGRFEAHPDPRRPKRCRQVGQNASAGRHAPVVLGRGSNS